MSDDSQEGLRHRESSQHFAASSTARQGHKMGLLLWKINGKKASQSCAGSVWNICAVETKQELQESQRKRRYRAGWQGRRSTILTNHPPTPRHLHGSLLDLFTPVNTFFASRGAWSQTQCRRCGQTITSSKGGAILPLDLLAVLLFSPPRPQLAFACRAHNWNMFKGYTIAHRAQGLPAELVPSPHRCKGFFHPRNRTWWSSRDSPQATQLKANALCLQLLTEDFKSEFQ